MRKILRIIFLSVVSIQLTFWPLYPAMLYAQEEEPTPEPYYYEPPVRDDWATDVPTYETVPYEAPAEDSSFTIESEQEQMAAAAAETTVPEPEITPEPVVDEGSQEEAVDRFTQAAEEEAAQMAQAAAQAAAEEPAPSEEPTVEVPFVDSFAAAAEDEAEQMARAAAQAYTPPEENIPPQDFDLVDDGAQRTAAFVIANAPSDDTHDIVGDPADYPTLASEVGVSLSTNPYVTSSLVTQPDVSYQLVMGTFQTVCVGSQAIGKGTLTAAVTLGAKEVLGNKCFSDDPGVVFKEMVAATDNLTFGSITLFTDLVDYNGVQVPKVKKEREELGLPTWTGRTESKAINRPIDRIILEGVANGQDPETIVANNPALAEYGITADKIRKVKESVAANPEKLKELKDFEQQNPFVDEGDPRDQQRDRIKAQLGLEDWTFNNQKPKDFHVWADYKVVQKVRDALEDIDAGLSSEEALNKYPELKVYGGLTPEKMQQFIQMSPEERQKLAQFEETTTVATEKEAETAFAIGRTAVELTIVGKTYAVARAAAAERAALLEIKQAEEIAAARAEFEKALKEAGRVVDNPEWVRQASLAEGKMDEMVTAARQGNLEQVKKLAEEVATATQKMQGFSAKQLEYVAKQASAPVIKQVEGLAGTVTQTGAAQKVISVVSEAVPGPLKNVLGKELSKATVKEVYSEGKKVAIKVGVEPLKENMTGNHAVTPHGARLPDVEYQTAVAEVLEDVPVPVHSHEHSIFDIVHSVFAKETDAGVKAFEAESFEDAIKQQLLINRRVTDGALDPAYIEAVTTMDALHEAVRTFEHGYQLTTGKEGSVTAQLPNGTYQVIMSDLPDLDITVPKLVTVTGQGRVIVPIAVRKGSGKVSYGNPTRSEGMNVYAAEKSKETDTEAVIFSDTNGDGVLDKDEHILTWAGVSIGLRNIATSNTILFQSGWNLVTLPVIPSNSITASTFLKSAAAAGGYATTIATFDGGAWKSYIMRGDTTFSGDDFPILPGKAYFVKALKPGELAIDGQGFVSAPAITLHAGWNAVGFPGGSATSVSEIFGKLNSTEEVVKSASRFDSGLWDSYVQDQNARFGADYPLEKGQGYMIFTGKDTSISL